MAPEFEDPLARRLFEAARREQPRAAVRTRTARAVAERRGPWSFSWPKLGMSVALAGLLGLVIVLSYGGATAPTISAERPPIDHARAGEVANRAPAPTPVLAPPERSVGRSTVPPAIPPRVAASAKPRLATQQDELELLDRARELLTAGDAASALSALERYERTRSERRLGAEAALLRIQALAATGRATEASALAARFIALYPNNPLTDRARSYVSGSTSPNPRNPGAER